MSDTIQPSFDELQAEAKHRWNANAATIAEKQKDLREKLAEMPDVKGAPTPADIWGHPAIACPCGNVTFTVNKWACINGVRNKAELECRTCGKVGTWSWESMTWL